MYHILPPQSQAQFGIGESPDDKGNVAPSRSSGLKFRRPSGAASAAWMMTGGFALRNAVDLVDPK
jgi:hypothetical protein